jgi:hypothetical protein
MRTRPSVFYVGGKLGGTQRNRTYYPGVRPGESGIAKARQALVRRYGNQPLAVTSRGGGSAHTSNSPDNGSVTPQGSWQVAYREIPDDSSVDINFGAASGIAAVFGWMEIKRGTTKRDLRTIRLAQINATTFLGTEIDQNSSGDTSGVTIVASIGGGDLILTLTTSDETPDAIAYVQLIYTVLAET